MSLLQIFINEMQLQEITDEIELSHEPNYFRRIH